MSNSTAKIIRSSDGCEIYAEASGNPQNPHVVLVHGMTFSGGVFDDFCQQPRLLDEVYIVSFLSFPFQRGLCLTQHELSQVRYDLRGHGRSGKPENSEAHSSKLCADDFIAVVQAFNLHRPVFVGWYVGA